MPLWSASGAMFWTHYKGVGHRAYLQEELRSRYRGCPYMDHFWATPGSSPGSLRGRVQTHSLAASKGQGIRYPATEVPPEELHEHHEMDHLRAMKVLK